ncbi:uncharacterized protein LOC124957491 [Vespa velutina]|uniref:uncharacterized protein LOC124957491 n=1 Tax=Vespa velutina TaxID=202808 RepID=UPI001FB4B29E|nr:uncharacterized protein LOC124957491 [Vespa velutina]
MGLLGILITTLGIISKCFCLLGYDCGGGSTNITTISLLDTGECNIPLHAPNATEVYIQLLQLAEYDHTHVHQCRVEIDRTIYYCGMSSHVSAVQNGRRIYLMDLTAEACKATFNTGILGITPSLQVSGLRANATEYRSATLAGSLSMDGKCSGTQYADTYGTWDNVVVQASIKINIKEYYATVKIAQNNVILSKGEACVFTDGMCITDEEGNAFWSTRPESSCNSDNYKVLYEGLATKLKAMGNAEIYPDIYTITTQDVTFTLEKRAEHHLCGYTLLLSEHPKLFILETQKGRTFASKAKLSVENLDLFAYVNSKFVYLEKHIRTQMTALYSDVIRQKCELEKQVLKNALALATLRPDEFAYTIMKAAGYMAVTVGEVIHIVKCTPVPVSIRQSEECYHELPVTHQNNSLYLTPKSRILVKTGTIKECNALLPSMYYLEGNWYRLTPKPVEVLPPQILQPLTKLAWKYTNTKNLMTSGIYTHQDLDNLRDHIMFPAERPGLLNTIARGATGHRIPPNTVSMYNLLGEADINRITDSAVSKLWQGFLAFGSASAGMIGLFILIKGVKLCVDAIIRGYVLHTVYGWSLHLLGAIWSSLTHLLLHLGRSEKQDETKTTESDKENDAIEVKVDDTTDDVTPTPATRGSSRYPILESILAARKTKSSEIEIPNDSIKGGGVTSPRDDVCWSKTSLNKRI